MSEVKKFITRWSRDFQGNLQEDPNGSWVLAADAAIRDKRLTDKIYALQALLTAADERADVLEGFLREAMPALDLAASAFKSAMPVRSKVRAALKPAEPAKEGHVCTGCGNKGWTANCKECVPY